ncbi:MAX gene-associated protein-like isoform X6 [Leucoraja erinacea]|uniref:MAX gene-associated protein-like isoform X6 n=1 Tax=Leucoraja erinaceus TaxID=7782 RepID=UPI0024554DF4|nr:MAX gene-associated protein-like isoform X6 [Leucoraja erinacea]
MNKSSINDVDATSSAATKQPLIKPIGVAKPKMQSVECTKVPVVHLEPCIFTNVPVNISELPQKLLSSCRRKGEPIPIVLQHPNSAKKPTHSFSSAENSQVENVDSKSICSGPKKNSSASEKNMNETRTSTVSNNPTASDGTPPEKSSGEDFSFRKIKYTEKALNSGTWKTPSRIFRDSAENSPEEPVCSKSARLNTKAFSSGICIPPDGGTDSTAETSTPHIESKSLGLSEQQATVGAHTQGRRKKLCLSAEPSQSVLRSSLASSKHLECDKTFNDASPDLDDVEGASFVPYASQENSKENNNGTVTACKLNRCKNSTAMKGVGVIVGNTRNQGVGVGSFGYRLHSPVQYPDGQIIQLVPLPNPGSNLHQEVTLAVRNPGSGSENHLPTPIKSCSVASSPKNVTPCPKVTIPKRGRRRSTPDVKPACVALQTSTPQQISAVVSEVPVQTTSQAKFEAVNGVGQTINAGSEKTANQNSKSEEKLIEPGREEIHVADSELIETTVSQSVPDEDHVNADPLPEVKQATVAFPSTPLVREVDDELEDDSMDHQNALEHLTPAELVDHSHTSEKQIVEDENENFVLDNSTRTAKGSAVDKDSSRSNHEVVDKEPEEMPSMEEKNRLQDEQMEVEMEDKTCCFEASTFNVPLKRGEDMQKNPDNEELNFHQKLLQNENFLDTDKDTDSQSHLVDADSQGDAEKIDVVRMFDSNSTEEPMDIEPVEKPSEKINIALLTTYASHLRSKSNILKCLPNIYSTNPSSVASSENYGGPFKIIVEEEPPDDYEYNHVANPVILDCDGLKCKEKEFFDSEGWDGGTNCDLQSKTMNKSSINEVDATSSAVTKQPLISPIGVIKAKMLSVECTKVLAVYLEPYTFTNGTIKISELPQQLLSSGRRKGRPIPTVLQSPNSAKETIHSSSSAENSQVENVDAKSVCSGLKESGSASEKNVNKTSTSTVPNNPTASPGTSPEKSSGEGFKFRKIKYTEKAFNSGIWRTPQDALQSHVVEHVAEEPSNPIHPTANPQESEEEKIEEKKEETIEQLEEQLLEDLSHVDPIVITHPLREKEEVSFVSRTGKTNDFTKLKGWKQKLQGLLFPRLKGGKRQHSGSISKQNQTSAKPEYSLKNTSDVSSDKSDEYLENEEKIAQQSAALCMNKASNVVYQMPPKSSSYVHTLDSVLKSQSPQDDCRGSRTSTRTSVSPQPISVGSVSKNTKQIEMTLGPVADSKEQKSANNTKESSTPAKSAAKTSLPPSFAPMSPPRLSKKQIELMILENRALWVEKPRTCITEERADASLVPLLAAQAKSKGNNSGTVTVCKSNRSRNSTTIEAMESEKLDGFETNSMPPNAAQTTKRKQTEKTDSPLHCDSPQEERTSFQSETPQLSVETKNTSKLIEIISDCNWDSERSNIFGFLARYRYIEQETFGENKRPLEKIRIGNFVIEIVSNYGKNRDPSPGPVLISSFVVKISQSSEKEGNGKCNMSVPITTQSPGIQLTETPPNAPKETLPTPTKCTVQEKEFTGNGNGGTKLTLGHIGALHPVNWVTANHKNKIKVVEQFKMSSSSTVASSAAAHLPSKHLTTCSTSSGNDVLCDTNDATPVNQSKGSVSGNCLPTPIKSCSMASSPSNVILCPKQMIPKRGRPRSTPVVFPTPIKSCSMASSPSNVILCPKGIIPQRGRPRSTRVINPTCVALKQTFTPQPISAVASEVPVKTTSQPPIVAVNGVGQTISAWHLVPLQPVGFALLQLPQGMSNPIVTAGQSLKLVNQSSGSQSFEKAGSEKTANQNNKSEEKLIEPGLEEIIVAVSELIETTVSQGVPDEDHVNADPSPEVKQATDAFPSTPSVIEVDDEFEDDSMDHQNALEHHTPAELVDHSYTCVKHIVEEENDNSVLDNSTRTGKGSAVDKDSYRSNHEVDKDMLKNSENEDLDFHQRLLRYENFMDSDKDTDSQSDLEDGDSQSDPEEMDERMFDSTSSEEGMDIENMEEISDKINIDHLIAYASRLTSKSKCHFNNPYLANKLDEVVEGDIKSKPKHIANLSKEAQAQLDALMEWRSTRTENERQRRSELRDLFEKLKKTLAIRGEEKASKYFILKQAFAEIQNLQNDSDCLSAGESVQTRRRDSLLQKISLLTGQTEEVILKNLENNCALDVEKRTSMQEGDDASEQHSVSGNTASISSMDSLPKVAMDLQIQKPPNVTMLCGGQDLMSEASRAKPLILTRKHSSTPQSSTSSIPLTTGSLLMTPQDHVPTLKGPLISDQTPFFTAEGLLNENQSKGDGVTGASIADDEVSSFMMPRIVNVTSLATGESPLLNPEEANDSCALSRDFSMKGRKYTSQEQLSPMTSKKPSLSIIKSNSQSSEQFTAPDESEAM